MQLCALLLPLCVRARACTSFFCLTVSSQSINRTLPKGVALHVDLLGGAVYHKSRSYPLEIDVIEFVFVLLMDYFQKTCVEI